MTLQPAETTAGGIDRYDPDVVARLQQAAARGHAAAQAVRPENTQATYASAMKAWVRFLKLEVLNDPGLADEKVPVDCANAGLLSDFARWLLVKGRAVDQGTGYSAATAGSYLAGVVTTLRETYGCDISVTDSKAAYSTLRGIVRRAESTPDAPPLPARGSATLATLPELIDAYDAVPRAADGTPTLAGLRDRALLLVAFHVAGRISEVAGLDVDRIAEDPSGLRITVHGSKTKGSKRTVAVPNAARVELCAVKAWAAWRTALVAAHPAYATNPAAFITFTQTGVPGGRLSAVGARRLVGRIGARAGHEGWTGHTLRAGFATAARAGGADTIAITRQGGWVPNSAAVGRYVREVDQWHDSAAIAAVSPAALRAQGGHR